MTITYDIEKQYNLIGHTYTYLNSIEKESKNIYDNEEISNSFILRVLTYNAWNTNPPTYIFDSYNRVVRFNKRMKLFTQYIREANPSIACIQEVRFDEGLGQVGDHSQIKVLVSQLPDLPYYYYQVFYNI